MNLKKIFVWHAEVIFRDLYTREDGPGRSPLYVFTDSKEIHKAATTALEYRDELVAVVSVQSIKLVGEAYGYA